MLHAIEGGGRSTRRLLFRYIDGVSARDGAKGGAKSHTVLFGCSPLGSAAGRTPDKTNCAAAWFVGVEVMSGCEPEPGAASHGSCVGRQ